MRAGKLDRKISLERAETVQDTVGHPTETWSEYASVWASVTGISGSEAIRAAGTISAETSKFVIRYRDDVLVTDRINYSGKTWNISFLRELGRREGLEITAGAVQ